jgi:hypothetical protein
VKAGVCERFLGRKGAKVRKGAKQDSFEFLGQRNLARTEFGDRPLIGERLHHQDTKKPRRAGVSFAPLRTFAPLRPAKFHR